jgi:hypothetical protein
MGFPSPVGAGPNSLAKREQFPPCLLSQPELLVVGLRLNRSIPGVFMLGNTFKTLRSFSSGHVQFCTCMNTPNLCLNKGPGWCVLMRKRVSKHGRVSKLLVQQYLGIQCTNLHATIDMVSCI